MRKKTTLLSLLLGLYLLLAGCAVLVAGAAAGGAGVVYYNGWLTDQVNPNVPQTMTAVRSGLKNLKMPIHEERHDMLKGKVNSELADGKNVYIKLKATESGMTELKIRVGTIGDKDASYMILNSIKKYL